MKWQDYELMNLLASFLLLLISLVLTTRKKGRDGAGIFLILYFWCFFLAVFISYMVHFMYVLKAPHLFRVGHVFTVLIMPLSYFYMLQNLYPRKYRYKDVFHFLPLVIYLVDYFPFLVSSASEKISLLKSLNVQEIRMGFGEGWFMPRYGHVMVRYGMAAVYCVLQFRLIQKAERSPEHPVVFENPAIIHWMKIMVGTESIFFLVPLVSALFLDPAGIAVVTTFAALLVSLLQGYYLLFRPEVLYGIHQHFSVQEANEAVSMETAVPGKEYYTDEMLEEAGHILDRYMETARPYLKAGYKVNDLAGDTGLTVHRISAYCNRNKKVNFFGYMNKYRIDYCLEKFASGEHQNKTLEALADECGFQNRGTFIRVFKSIMGKTPSEYLALPPKSVSL